MYLHPALCGGPRKGCWSTKVTPLVPDPGPPASKSTTNNRVLSEAPMTETPKCWPLREATHWVMNLRAPNPDRGQKPHRQGPSWCGMLPSEPGGRGVCRNLLLQTQSWPGGQRGLGVVPPDLHPGLRILPEGQRQSSSVPWCRARSASWEGAGVQTPEEDPGCPARFWLQKESLYPWGVPQATCARTRAVGIEATHGLRRRAAGGVCNARIAIRALRVRSRTVRGADASEEGAYASRNLSLKGRPVPSADAPQALSAASRRDAPALGFAGRTFLKFKLRLSIQACALSQR